MALFYNPTSVHAAALLQKRPVSKAQEQEMLSRALQEQMANDPRSGQIQDWRDRAMTPFGVGAGLTGVAAQMASALVAKGQEKKLAGEYQGRQAKQNEMYAKLLNPQPGGTSPLDSLTPAQRQMIEPMLADPDMREQAAAFLTKQAFEPAAQPKYEKVGNELIRVSPDGKVEKAYAAPPDKPQDVQEYEYAKSQFETANPGRPFMSFTDFDTSRRKAGASNVNNVTKMESEWDKGIGGEMAKGYIEQQNRARAADSTISQIGRFRTVMGNTKMGPVASATLPVRSALNELGITDDQNVPNQEELTAMSNRFALDVVGNMKGPSSDKDMVFAKDTVVSLSKSNPGNTAILDVAERVARRDQQYAQWQDEYRKANGGRLDPGVNEYIRQKAAETPMFAPQERQKLEALRTGKPGAQAPASAARPKIRNITVE